jgi:hypothetical protein
LIALEFRVNSLISLADRPEMPSSKGISTNLKLREHLESKKHKELAW